MSKENNGVLYPSVSGSYVFTETLNGALPWLNFGKVRLGYAEVGSDADVNAYSDQLFYSVNPNTINNPSGTAVTVGSSGAALPNRNLKPMRIKETEVGIELKMFNNRVNFDAAVYKKMTIDQIVPVQISDASSFTSTLINSGESQNKGFEALLNLNLSRAKEFQMGLYRQYGLQHNPGK